MHIIDLSLPLEDDSRWAPWWARTRVRHQNHKFGLLALRMLFGLKSKHLRTGLGWANDTVELSTHGTTHVDAPWHYAPESDGRPARTIDELPLDWFIGTGVVLDIRELPHDAAASASDLELALPAGHALQPGDIALIQTGNDRLWGTREYFDAGPGVSAEGTRWLIEQGVRLMGIDSWGWDRPLRAQAREARETGRNDVFWEAHFVGVDREYCHMERLANLDQLPPWGFTVCAFPLKVRRGSAGPARVVALLDASLPLP
jgi:kynurenine formamidase